MEVTGWLMIEWNNELVAWDEDDYSGLKRILFEKSDDVWIPDLSQYNLVLIFSKLENIRWHTKSWKWWQP